MEIVEKKTVGKEEIDKMAVGWNQGEQDHRYNETYKNDMTAKGRKQIEYDIVETLRSIRSYP